MRTTVDIPEHLLIRAKHLAADQHLSLAAVVAESLRAYLAASTEHRALRPAKPVLPVLKGKPRKGVDLADNSAMLETE